MTKSEAIERLRQLYSDTNAENKAALECLIPELKDSETEDIMYIVKYYGKHKQWWHYVVISATMLQDILKRQGL